MTTYLLVSSALCVLVVVVVANHSATSTKQPNKHKQSSNTHNNVDSTFQPSGSHCDPGYKVKSKNTHKQPVESANNSKYKRNHSKNVECFVQVCVLLVSCVFSMSQQQKSMHCKKMKYKKPLTLVKKQCHSQKTQQRHKKRATLPLCLQCALVWNYINYFVCSAKLMHCKILL